MISVAATQIRCITEKFPATGSVALTLTVNGIASASQTLSITDLEVSLVSATDPTKVYPMYVIEIDTVNNAYIKVRYGCAESGIYNVIVHSKTFGNFDTTGITVTT